MNPLEEQEELLEERTLCLFGDDFNDKIWKEEWQDMPEFIQRDREPMQHIVVNFDCYEDVEEFGKLIEQNVTPKTNSLWFPKQETIEPKNFLYINENATTIPNLYNL